MSLDNTCTLDGRLAKGGGDYVRFHGADHPLHPKMLVGQVCCLTAEPEGTGTTCR